MTSYFAPLWTTLETAAYIYIAISAILCIIIGGLASEDPRFIKR